MKSLLCFFSGMLQILVLFKCILSPRDPEDSVKSFLDAVSGVMPRTRDLWPYSLIFTLLDQCIFSLVRFVASSQRVITFHLDLRSHSHWPRNRPTTSCQSLKENVCSLPGWHVVAGGCLSKISCVRAEPKTWCESSGQNQTSVFPHSWHGV